MTGKKIVGKKVAAKKATRKKVVGRRRIVSGGRDNFSPVTRDKIAKRSGYICAYPDCRRMTVAGSDDRKTGITMTGVAAHITAAARNGPRFDAGMSKAERKSEANGIWTCQIHGKFIDDNSSKCSVDEVRRWKEQHEKWVFDRVESGGELFNKGVYRVGFKSVGVFPGEFKIPFGRNNVLVGSNESGKSTFCQIISAFSGGDHWSRFSKRFNFSGRAKERAHIELSHLSDHKATRVRISPQTMATGSKKATNSRVRLHVEIDGNPSPDWPRSLFRVLHFDAQLYRVRASDPKDSFVKALRYLADILGVDEDFVWDSLREELFASSVLGNRFRRIGHRNVSVLVPDGRDFYVPHAALSSTEQQMAYLDIALRLTSCTSGSEGWIYILDTGFFQRFDKSRKLALFETLCELGSRNVQTLFCLHSVEDAELLKQIQSDKWVNAERFGQLTLHSFL